MKLTCPECSTSYAASPTALGDGGRKVKCHKCAHVWFATLQEAFGAQDALEAEPSQAMPADAGDAAEPTQTVDFDAIDVDDDVDGDDTLDGEELLSSDEAEADATWDSVLEDVGLAAPDNDGNDVVFVDAGDASHESALDDDSLDIETLAARRLGNMRQTPSSSPGEKKARGKRNWSVPAVPFSTPLMYAASLAVALGLAAGGALVMRDQVVSLAPGSAQLYASIGYPVNLRGLDLVNVSFVKGVENGMPVLAVTGEIVNISDTARAVPELRFSLRNELSQEIYHWTGRADAGELGPAGRARFLTRLAAPPVAAREIQVRFTGKAQASDGSRS